MEDLGVYGVGVEENLHLIVLFQVGNIIITFKVAGSCTEACVNTVLVS